MQIAYDCLVLGPDAVLENSSLHFSHICVFHVSRTCGVKVTVPSWISGYVFIYCQGDTESYSEWSLTSVARLNYWLWQWAYVNYISIRLEQIFDVIVEIRKCWLPYLESCDWRKWKGISEVAILLEDAHQNGYRGPSSTLLGMGSSPHSSCSRVESGTVLLSALCCGIGPNADSNSVELLLEWGRLFPKKASSHIVCDGIMPSNEQTILSSLYLEHAVIKMPVRKKNAC